MLREIMKLLAAAALLGLNANAAALPRDGDYLSTAYLAVLEKTKSHKKAWETEETPVMTVSREKSGLVRLLLGNWHEGTWAAFDPKNPTMNLDKEGGVTTPFKWIDATHFKFGDGATYLYVGKAEAYIAQKLLAGRYVDARGKTYVFGSDGKAQFPNRTFRFEIYGDMVFEPCDEFLDLDATKQNDPHAIGFGWRGSRLYLYSLDCNSGQSAGCIFAKTPPIAVLHRVGR